MKRIFIFLTLMAIIKIATAQNFTNIISGKLIGRSSYDGLKVVFKTYKNDQLIENRLPASILSTAVNSEGEFKTGLAVLSQDFYLEIELFRDNEQIHDFLDKVTNVRFYSQRGDSLNLTLNFLYKTAYFTGKGSEKMNCQYKLKDIDMPNSSYGLMADHTLTKEPKYSLVYRMYKALFGMREAVLKSYATVIPAPVYLRISRDLVFQTKHDMLGKVVSRSSDPSTLSKNILHDGIQLLNIFRQDESSLVTIDSGEILSPYRCQYILDNAFIKYGHAKVNMQTNLDLTRWMLTYVKSFKTKLSEDILIAFTALRARELSESFNEKVLADYLAQIKNNENKQVFNQILSALRPEGIVIPYEFIDFDGKKVRSEDLQDKIVIMDFWFTGCIPCMSIPPVMKSIIAKLKHRSDIIYLSVSLDSNKEIWRQAVKSGKYTLAEQIHVFTAGRAHPFVVKYQIGEVPHLIVIGKNNKILSFNEEVRNDNGEHLIQIVEREN